ncbi:hypothetical protein PIROE2DRAFT_17253 [Piromyces sp. E2]|nr:hypothetical protein PIROE2DRAFT_17253 [Piromyces sp. E2]|eukprot:OUM57679.1 hypothetical protein PIROE2DRAFT_17253 [Piromyces sp. E2]
MSICEILYPLIKLKSVVISNEDECNNPNLLGNLINKFNIDYIFITPSRLHYYLKDENYSKSINNIKCLLMGGEGCNKETLREIINYTDGNIYNLYGPTETTIMCTISELSKKFNKSNKNVNKITIGKPLCNCKLYILDKYLKPVPIGVEGEIYIGGYCVGKGYLNRKNLTQEKFVECPYSSEKNSKKLMYSTGDLGKWTEEGEIECLGRIDFQVKIHGQRMELGEIESLINEIEGIEQVVVIDKEKENKEKYLIGYYVCSFEIDSKKIREYLKTKLPIYMIPSYFQRIEKIPLTKNGKLNRKNLPEPNKEDIIKEQYIVPETRGIKLSGEFNRKNE